MSNFGEARVNFSSCFYLFITQKSVFLQLILLPMEQLLHYCWKHRLFPPTELLTTEGEVVEVIDPGLHNHHAGPDFFNAKIRIGGTLWVGNVEIHDKASDWYAHGHESDAAYDNVVLHVCSKADRAARTHDGRLLPQMVIQVPEQVQTNYQELLITDRYPPCYRIIPQLSSLTIHSWMSALQVERLERKTRDIEKRVALCDGSWEHAYFVTLARNYGFGVNGDVFEQWALSIPASTIVHHRDDLFQVEAFFMGQAGLLDMEAVPPRYQQTALAEGYFTRLRQEYTFLSHKFGTTPLPHSRWKFLRMRPQNFPHIRIAQIARLYHERRTSLRQLVECATVAQAREMLHTSVTEYWQTHYTFGSPSASNSKQMSPFSINLLLINTVVPLLFAYGRHTGNDSLCDRAFTFLEQLRAEENNITRMWQDCGLKVSTAGDSQALIQLKNEYCNRRDCLRCRIGYEYLQRT